MSRGEIFFNLQIRSTEYANSQVKSQINQSINISDMHEYYDRDEACDKSIDNEIDSEDAFNYYNYRIGSTGCFNNKGMVDKDIYFDKMKKYKPDIIYRGVFSFRPEFALEHDILETPKMRKLIRKTMDKNIKAMGFEPNNVEWFAFYHTNTSHPHVHFHFYEKERKKKRFIISKQRLLKVKSNIARLMTIDTVLYSKRDENKKKIIEKLEELGLSKESRHLLIYSECNSKKYLKEDIKITKELQKLEKILPRTGSMKYNSANIAPYKEKIKRVIDYIKQKDELKEYIDIYKEYLEKEIEGQVILYGGNKNDKYKKQFYENRINQLDSKIGNMILSNIMNYREDIATFTLQEKEIDKSYNYHRQRLSTKTIHNLKTRSQNIIAGIAKEICYDIERSFYCQVKTQQMIKEVQNRAKSESLANNGIKSNSM